MVSITNTTQLSTFSIIRGIILTNATLATKFKTKDIYEFEPKHKSSSFNGFPYIWINVPEVDEAEKMIGNYLKSKEFEIEIILRMDYMARDNFTSYASNLITVLDAAESTFNANGYNMINIRTSGNPEAVIMDQKELIEGRFILTLRGEVVI